MTVPVCQKNNQNNVYYIFKMPYFIRSFGKEGKRDFFGTNSMFSSCTAKLIPYNKNPKYGINS